MDDTNAPLTGVELKGNHGTYMFHQEISYSREKRVRVYTVTIKTDLVAREFNLNGLQAAQKRTRQRSLRRFNKDHGVDFIKHQGRNIVIHNPQGRDRAKAGSVSSSRHVEELDAPVPLALNRSHSLDLSNGGICESAQAEAETETIRLRDEGSPTHPQQPEVAGRDPLVSAPSGSRHPPPPVSQPPQQHGVLVDELGRLSRGRQRRLRHQSYRHESWAAAATPSQSTTHGVEACNNVDVPLQEIRTPASETVSDRSHIRTTVDAGQSTAGNVERKNSTNVLPPESSSMPAQTQENSEAHMGRRGQSTICSYARVTNSNDETQQAYSYRPTAPAPSHGSNPQRCYLHPSRFEASQTMRTTCNGSGQAVSNELSSQKAGFGIHERCEPGLADPNLNLSSSTPPTTTNANTTSNTRQIDGGTSTHQGARGDNISSHLVYGPALIPVGPPKMDHRFGVRTIPVVRTPILVGGIGLIGCFLCSVRLGSGSIPYHGPSASSAEQWPTAPLPLQQGADLGVGDSVVPDQGAETGAWFQPQ